MSDPQIRELSPAPTWAERVRAAYDAWHHWHLIPGRFRMDEAVKATGLRAVIVERDRFRAALQQIERSRTGVTTARRIAREALEGPADA